MQEAENLAKVVLSEDYTKTIEDKEKLSLKDQLFEVCKLIYEQ